MYVDFPLCSRSSVTAAAVMLMFFHEINYAENLKIHCQNQVCGIFNQAGIVQVHTSILMEQIGDFEKVLSVSRV